MRRMYAARTVITISILLITFTVTACQPTPDNPIVADKNMENMIDSAKETQTADAVNESLRDKVSSPETFVYNDTQGKLTITANADVFVPDVASMSIINVKSGMIPQETVDRYWDALIGGAQMWEWSEQPTKADFEEMIVRESKDLSDAQQKQQPQDIINGIQERLDYFKTMYETAPDSTVSVPCDGKLKEQVYWDPVMGTIDTRYMGLKASTVKNSAEMANAEQYQWLYVTNPWTGPEGSVKPYEGPAQLMYNTAALNRNYTHGGTKISADDVPDAAVREKLNMTPKQAVEAVKAFFEKTGTPMKVLDIYLDGDMENLDGSQKEAENYAYYLDCIRVLDGGLPVANVKGVPLMMPQEEGSCSPLIPNNAPEYSKPWYWEDMSVLIDDEGFIEISWFAPLEVADTEVKDSKLLTFEDIEAVFKNMITVKYEAAITDGYTMECDITNVRLEMMRVRKQNSDQIPVEGLLIPVWNFYGMLTVYDSGGKQAGGTYKGDSIILSVNAVDGSIIDTH